MRTKQIPFEISTPTPPLESIPDRTLFNVWTYAGFYCLNAKYAIQNYHKMSYVTDSEDAAVGTVAFYDLNKVSSEAIVIAVRCEQN